MQPHQQAPQTRPFDLCKLEKVDEMDKASLRTLALHLFLFLLYSKSCLAKTSIDAKLMALWKNRRKTTTTKMTTTTITIQRLDTHITYRPQATIVKYKVTTLKVKLFTCMPLDVFVIGFSQVLHQIAACHLLSNFSTTSTTTTTTLLFRSNWRFLSLLLMILGLHTDQVSNFSSIHSAKLFQVPVWSWET